MENRNILSRGKARMLQPTHVLLLAGIFCAVAGAQAQSEAATSTTTVSGILQVWSGYAGGERRAYLLVDDVMYRLFNWEQYESVPGFQSDAVITAAGTRFQGPVLPSLNLSSVKVQQAPEPWSLGSGGRRKLMQYGPAPQVGLKLLVIRVKLPDGCSPSSSLVGGCSEAAWNKALWGDSDSLSGELSTCTWGKVNYNQAGSVITAYVTIPCTPLRSTGNGYCGDEQNKWMADSLAVLRRQGVRPENYDHLIFDMPKLSCSWTGQGSERGSWVMMNSNCGKGTIIHELGHNYGVQHSNVLRPSGSYVEYGDLQCVMGAGTSNGADSKCFSLPWMHYLGLASPRVITADSLQAGASITVTMGIVWSAANQGVMIDTSSFGVKTSSKYYLSLQADSGPMASLKNMHMYADNAGIFRKVLVIHKMPFTDSDPSNGRLAVLGANSKWTLNDIGVVVRPQTFAQDGSSVVVSLCRISNGNSCGEPARPDPQQYWKFRPSSDLGKCMAVCMGATGNACQPNYNTHRQRQVIFDSAQCSGTVEGDGSTLWWFDGLLIRNKLTGWCLDPALATNYASPAQLVVRPCLDNGNNGGDSPLQQMWLWGQPSGTAVTLPQQGSDYFTSVEINRFINRWTVHYSNVCPMISTQGGSTFSTFAYAYSGYPTCTDESSVFTLGNAFRFAAGGISSTSPSSALPSSGQASSSPPVQLLPVPSLQKASPSPSPAPLPSPTVQPSQSTSLITLECTRGSSIPLSSTSCTDAQQALQTMASNTASLSTTCGTQPLADGSLSLRLTIAHSTGAGTTQAWVKTLETDFWNRLFWSIRGSCACTARGSFIGTSTAGFSSTSSGCTAAGSNCMVVSGCPTQPSPVLP